jgi:hypothetical protein
MKSTAVNDNLEAISVPSIFGSFAPTPLKRGQKKKQKRGKTKSERKVMDPVVVLYLIHIFGGPPYGGPLGLSVLRAGFRSTPPLQCNFFELFLLGRS